MFCEAPERCGVWIVFRSPEKQTNGSNPVVDAYDERQAVERIEACLRDCTDD